MRNVVAPIDIAFIDKNGTIESIQAMQPYVLGSNKQPTYGPMRPVVGALEGHQGFYKKHRIEADTDVSWEILSDNS